MIDGSEKRFVRLSFEFWSPHVIERRSKTNPTTVDEQFFLMLIIATLTSNTSHLKLFHSSRDSIRKARAGSSEPHGMNRRHES